MEKDEILIRYEALYDYDYKIKITKGLAKQYLIDMHLYKPTAARKTVDYEAALDPEWYLQYADDEVFYKFAKAVFYKEAKKTVSGDKYLLVWSKGNALLKREYSCYESVSKAFNENCLKNFPTAIYSKLNGKPWKVKPIRQSDLKLLNNGMEFDPNDEGDTPEKRRGACQQRRAVSSCEYCLRYYQCEDSSLHEKEGKNGKRD